MGSCMHVLLINPQRQTHVHIDRSLNVYYKVAFVLDLRPQHMHLRSSRWRCLLTAWLPEFGTWGPHCRANGRTCFCKPAPDRNVQPYVHCSHVYTHTENKWFCGLLCFFFLIFKEKEKQTASAHNLDICEGNDWSRKNSSEAGETAQVV